MPEWPHAPAHYAKDGVIYIITAGTYSKAHYFYDHERRNLLCNTLHEVCAEFAWQIQAWAVLSNHYHFIAIKIDQSCPLKKLINKLHMTTAKAVNAADKSPGRRVWYQYWDSTITFGRSYLARLNYVHNNPVHHGVVKSALEYPFCSAAWFERKADMAFYKTVMSFKTDRINVQDDF